MNPIPVVAQPSFLPADWWALGAVIALSAGGVGACLVAEAAIAGITPADSPLLWIGIGIALAVWLTGLYWRGDAPDSRREQTERERRGY